MVAQYYSDQVMRQTAHWASWFAADWKREFPLRLHSREIAPDGSPQWHPDFLKWLVGDRMYSTRCGDESRLRTTRAMRRLRKVAVREYEVLYRILVLDERLEDTTRWLNERAVRNQIPLPDGRTVHYTAKDTLALFIAGIDFCRACW